MAERIGVVFVHGFLSSAQTWSSFLKLLTHDADLAHLTFDAFPYPTPAVSLSPLRRIPNVDDVADSLRTYLADHLAGYSGLVLVSHSMGGLVVQRMLSRVLADGKGPELARIRRIVLFACPNSGSDLALLLRRGAFFWRHPQERELRPLNQAIAQAHRAVINQVVHASSLSATTCPIGIVAYAGESDAVVTPVSARSVLPDVGVLPGDHFSIIRPSSSADRVYTTLKLHLLEASSVPAPQPSPERKQPTPESPPTPQPASSRTSAQRHGELVDKLLAVPRMSEPAFREQLYDALPPVIVHQLRRDNAARVELFALVRSFGHYSHLAPWSALAAALEELVPDQPAVTDVVAVLAEMDSAAR